MGRWHLRSELMSALCSLLSQELVVGCSELSRVLRELLAWSSCSALIGEGSGCGPRLGDEPKAAIESLRLVDLADGSGVEPDEGDRRS